MTHPLLIAEPPFQVLPSLAGAVGFNEAAMLQVIHYWLSPQDNTHFRDGRYWVPNVFNKLYQKFFFWDEETIEYMIAQFEQSGILITFQDSNEARYHSIDYELLNGKDGAAVYLPPVTPFIEDILPKANKNRPPSFTAEVQVKGDSLYVMSARDLSHYLTCDLVLEVQENDSKQDGSRDVDCVCHFPRITDEKLKQFIWEDATLYEILMGVFKMNLMEQLLLFCVTHHASNLVIFADDEQRDGLGIYLDFQNYQGITPAPNVEKTGMVIPIGTETFDAWVDFMEGVTIKFRQTLWRAQRTNPAIYHYLKSRPLSDFEP